MPAKYNLPGNCHWRWTAEERVLQEELKKQFLEAGLSVRSANALSYDGYDLQSAREASDSELLRVINLGKISLKEVRLKLGYARKDLETYSDLELLEELSRRFRIKLNEKPK